jgi:hypothetical protein
MNKPNKVEKKRAIHLNSVIFKRVGSFGFPLYKIGEWNTSLKQIRLSFEITHLLKKRKNGTDWLHDGSRPCILRSSQSQSVSHLDRLMT